MADVIRHDIVKIGFDVENNPISKLNKEIENLKKVVAGLSGVDSFEELADNAKKAEKGMKNVKRSADDTNSSLKKVGSTIGKVTVKAAKFAAIGLGTAATGAVAMVKQSVSAYAEYEQLFGGMQTLLGAKGAKNVEEYAKLTNKSVKDVQNEYKKLTESEKLVMKNANDAFKSAGMSANQYMETITSFAASLKSSVGGDAMEAAKLADVAIKDMADNANKMGTPLESVSTVYSNLARGMYMTLDNLKLGYAGTKEGAKNLVNDAAKIDKSVKANDLSYANLVKAIHAVQVKMDIYGTTSKEAFGTITGSLSTFKSAWGNLMPALIQGGDAFDQCLTNLIDSIIGFKDETGKRKGGIIANLLPATEKALGGLGQLIEGVAPTIEKLLPNLIDKLLPPLVTAAANLFAGLLKSLPTIIRTFAKELPNVFRILGQALADSLGSQFPVLKKFGNVIKDNAKKITKFIPVVLGLVAAFKGFKMIKSITSLFGGKSAGGESGGGALGSITNTFSALAKTKTSTVLKGVANMSIILGALGGLLWIATKVFKNGINFTEMLQVTVLVGALGAVGLALGNFAGIVGKLPITTVLKGLVSMSLTLAAIGAILWAATKVFKSGVNFTEMIKVVTLVGIFGTVGAALSVFAGIVGMIPITTVLLGLLNIGLVLGGIGALLWAATKVFENGVNFSEMFQVITLIGIFGTIGSILAVFAGIAGVIPFPVVLAGLANIGLVLGGMTALIVAFGKLSEIKGFDEFITKGGETLANLFGQIGKIAGSLVGGLGEGLTSSLPAIGENIAGFAEKLKPMFSMFEGVDMSGVGSFFSALGTMVLKLSGGKILEFFGGEADFSGVADGLAAFNTEGVKGFFTMVQGIKKEAFENGSKFFKCLDGISALPNVGGICQKISGTNDYSGVADGLGDLSGDSVKKFFTMVQGLKKEAFDKGKKFFQCLDGISSLPNVGGIAQAFSGENDYSGVVSGLKTLSGDGVKKFFTMVQGLKKEAFDNAKKIWDVIKSCNDKGIAKMKFEGLADKGKSVSGFMNNAKGFVSGVSAMQEVKFGVVEKMVWGVGKMAKITDYEVTGIWKKAKSVSAFMNDAKGFLTGVQNIQGLKFGVVGKMVWAVGQMAKITSYNVTDIGEKADAVTDFMNRAKNFFSSAAEIDTTAVAAVATAINNFVQKVQSLGKTGFPELKGNVASIMSEMSVVVDKGIEALVSSISKLPNKMASGIKGGGSALSSAITAIWKDAAKASAKPVNKVIAGANWILKEFGSEKRVASWTPYAKGTHGHKGGNALVNDGRGAEIVQMPNGKTFIPQGKNVFIPNAPKGMKVLPAEQTAQLMGQKTPTYHYAKGTGNFDIWDYMDNPSGLIRAMKSNFVDYNGVTGLARHIGQGMVETITGQMTNWAKKLYDEFGIGKGWKFPSISRTITSYFGRRNAPTKGASSSHAGIDIGAPYGSPVFASKGGKVSIAGWSGGYGNLVEINHGQGWTSRYGHNSSLLVSHGQRVRQGQTIALVGSTGVSTGPHIHFEIRRNGGAMNPLPLLGGYANGGIATKPSIFGEDGAEMAIPLTRGRRDRATSLWEKTGRMLGYTPDGGSIGNYNETQNVENNTYAPVINITVNGSVDDRQTVRKIKKHVKEAIQEVFEGMDRRTPNLQTY